MTATPQSPSAASAAPQEVVVPAIGDFSDIPIIEIHVAEGDTVTENDPLVTLESDKATMDVPAPGPGTIQTLRVVLGDRVNVGSPLLTLLPAADPASTADGAAATAEDTAEDTAAQTSDIDQQELAPQAAEQVIAAAAASSAGLADDASGAASAQAEHTPLEGQPHAGPGVRRLARELGVDLAGLRGTGPKGRIVKDDLLASLAPSDEGAAASGTPSSGAGIPEVPAQDYAAFGPVEIKALPRITRLSGPYLHRSWLNVPHVTQNDEADITDLDAYRKELDDQAKTRGERVTLLSFLLKASAATLREYPQVNSSLTAQKDSLVYKSYYHIGVAVDTPDGLVVPVVRDVDRKGISELSAELGRLSGSAREGRLAATDMQGATFTISSLGGIGGTSFTPIVNAPEVAILGVVRAKVTPVWNGRKFKPRLVLPLSFSYDHRVIDGALAARFTRSLCHRLEDVRRLLL